WRFLAESPTEELVAAIDFRHIRDALPPAEATAILDKGQIGLAERLALLESDGFPSSTTSVGWLGYPDEKVRDLTRSAYAGDRRGGGQPGDLQAVVAGRGDPGDADRRVPGRRRRRGTGRTAAGRQVRGAGLPARRRCRPVRAGPAPRDLRLPAGRHLARRPD